MLIGFCFLDYFMKKNLFNKVNIKIVFLNIFSILAILGFFVLAPIVTQIVYDLIQRPFSNELSKNIKINKSYLLPNYDNIPWAKKHFYEKAQIETSYYDFVVWKHNKFDGETINIDSEGFRKTYGSTSNDIHDIWMFGGSTLWGAGSDDFSTIPSQLSKLTGLKIRNYGMSGWIVRQELNQLIHEYAKLNLEERNKQRIIINYDGANDGMAHCRTEMRDDLSTDRQLQIQEILKDNKNKNSHSLSLAYLFIPMTELITKLRNKITNSSIEYEKDIWWRCDDDIVRAEEIAKAVVKDWIYANEIAKKNGDIFIALLQPIAFFNSSPLDHLDSIGANVKLTEERSKQYAATYPLIDKFAKEANIEYHNLTSLLDINEYVYIDPMHLSPNGNLVVAKAVYDIVCSKVECRND